MRVFAAILPLLAGIGVFLTACGMLSENLEALGADWLRGLFGRVSDRPLLGVAVGAAGTAVIQSSGASTVMVVGLVNAGALTLRQAAAVIYGANIGTTVTAQLAALGLFGGGGLSAAAVCSALTGVGAAWALAASKPEGKRRAGILTGFGLLFVGLDLLRGGMEGLAAFPAVPALLSAVRDPLLLAALGAALTALVQSSSVVTSLAVALLASGLMGLEQGIFLTLGSNVGSCAAALLAGLSAGVTARRAAMVHLLFNLLGAGAFMLFSLALRLGSGGAAGIGELLGRFIPGAPQVSLAMFHTAFNLATAALALPLTGALTGLAAYLVPAPETLET